MSKMLSGKIRKTPSNQVSTGRYDFISLQETEPDLGVPGINNSFAASLVDGTRLWLYPNTGLNVDGNGNIDVDETTVFIDTSNLTFSNSNVLSNVLVDIDTNIVAISADLANALNVYTNDTLSGNGSISNILIVEKWNSEITVGVVGDATGNVSFDGSSNTTLTLDLVDTGVVSGFYGTGVEIPEITVDSKGRITNIGVNLVAIEFYVSDGSQSTTINNGETISIIGIPNEITTTVTQNNQVFVGLVDSPVVGNITANFTVTANTISDGVASLSNGLLSGQVSDISNHTTTDLAEGSNLYFTVDRVRSNISVTDTGGDGSLSYDTANGIITYTGPDQTEANARIDAAPLNVRQHISATGNINYDNVTGVISESLTTTDIDEGTNLYFTDERVDDRVANLLVAGTSIEFNYNDAGDSLTVSVANVDAITLDGLDSTQFLRSDQDDTLTGNLDVIGNVSASYFIGNVSVTDIEGLTTDTVEEGTVNLYFTDERVDDRVANLLQTTGNLSFTYNDGSNTLTLSESLTTDDIDEGTNLYYTNARVQAYLLNGVTDISTSGNVSVGADVVVTGNLFVNGTSTVIESVSLTVDDKNIELGNVATPTDITADGGGITLLGSTNKTLNWINATDSWTSSENFDISSGKTYKINNVDVLSATTLGSSVINSSLQTLGTINSGTWQGSVIQPTYGGTGVNNGSNTITLGGNFVTTGGSVQLDSVSGAVQLQIETGTNAIREDNLGAFNTTTSAQLFGVISNPTGTGQLVFNNSPTLISPVLGSANATSITTTGDVTVGNDIVVKGEVVDATSTGEEVARTAGIVTTINTTSVTPIDSWAFATYRSAKYLIQVEQGSDYQVSELRLIHDGTTVYTTEYAVIETSGKLGDFTGSITGSDVQITASMSSSALANIRIQRTLITV